MGQRKTLDLAADSIVAPPDLSCPDGLLAFASALSHDLRTAAGQKGFVNSPLCERAAQLAVGVADLVASLPEGPCSVSDSVRGSDE